MADPQRRLLDRNFGLEEYEFRTWSVKLEEDQTVDLLSDPRFFASVAVKIAGPDSANPQGIGDIVRVRKRATGELWEFAIIASGHTFIRLWPIKECLPPQPQVAEDSPLAFKYNSGKKNFDVIRVVDKVVTASGFQNKADAVAWIENHTKAMTAKTAA
jgi:hypothetical protein